MRPGTELPAVEVTPMLSQLVRYAGASGDFYAMHYDLDFAKQLGYRELPVHGLLKAALLGRMLRRWLRPGDRLLTFEVSYRGLDFRDEPMTLGGRVAEVVDGRARLDLWITSADGGRSTVGGAEVELTG
ncbi:MAG: MaoC/PaaZ C-terminal domain-containing protein [Nocardioidaceae bacterium]